MLQATSGMPITVGVGVGRLDDDDGVAGVSAGLKRVLIEELPSLERYIRASRSSLSYKESSSLSSRRPCTHTERSLLSPASAQVCVRRSQQNDW